MQNAKVVGVAFQGYSGDIAQGVAYMIPTPVIRRFLTDIKDNRYDKYVDLGLTYSKLQNPAQRRYLGLPDDGRGVIVDYCDRGGSRRERFSSKVMSCFPLMITRLPATRLSSSKVNE
jgi:hypothetical protein